MARYSTLAQLQNVLEQGCEKVRKPKSAVLFQRGDKNFGMFLVLRGRGSLDVGVDSPLTHFYGSGALIGLPATVTGRNYAMTATVVEDAELGFWSRDKFHVLLLERPDLCQQLLEIMAERVSENTDMLKAMLKRDKQPEQRSVVV
jgi:CRP-like cAMP-binding protein